MVGIRVGDGRTILLVEGVNVTVCLGDKRVTQHCRVLNTDVFDIVTGTDLLRRNAQVKRSSVHCPCALQCNLASGLFSVPVELSGRKESLICYMTRSYQTENYHLVSPVLESKRAAPQEHQN